MRSGETLNDLQRTAIIVGAALNGAANELNAMLNEMRLMRSQIISIASDIKVLKSSPLYHRKRSLEQTDNRSSKSRTFKA